MHQFSILDEIFSQVPASQAWLPDRFLEPKTSEEAWINVFGQERRLKKMADGIRKCSLIKSLPPITKKVIRSSDAGILTFFYGSEPMRGFMERAVNESTNNCLTLTASVPWLTQAFLEANPYESKSDDRYVDLLKRVDADFAESFIRFFHAITDKAFYEALSSKHKDMADMAINLILCHGDDIAILAFFQGCPWLASRQKRLIELIEEMLEEEEDDEEEYAASFTDELLERIRTLFSTADHYRIEASLKRHMAIRSQIRELVVFHAEHGADSFTQTLTDEHRQMVGLFTVAGNVFRRFKITEAIDLWSTLLADIAKLPELPRIDASCDEQIGVLDAFLGNRRATIQPVAESLQALQSSVVELERSMEQLSKITQSQDGGLDEILKLNETLIASRASAVSKARELAPVGTVLIQQVSALITEIARLQAIPKIDPVIRAQELEVQVAALTAESTTLSDRVSSLTEKNESLEKSLNKERTRRTNLEETADLARKEVHDLKTAMAGIGRPSASHVSSTPLVEAGFVVELMAGSAKLTPEVILKTFSALYPQDIVILDSALKSAKDAYNFEMGPRLVTLIQSMVEYLHQVREGKPDAEARIILGSSYASQESDTVVKNAKLRALREFSYEGVTELFLSHVSVGRGFGTQHQIRLYFKLIDNKLVIAHCGERFESATSN